jgi:CDP-4-dehydro-6-deoxyglucose reductase
VLLPWLPPGRARSKAFAVAVQPDDRILTARRGETLLEAGLREGLPMPYECRNGGCGVCKATLAYGEVSYGAYQESALSGAERAAGKILLCCAQALSDLEIAYVPLAGAAPAPVRQYRGRVVALEPLSHDVMRLAVRVEDGGHLRFHAGQYINVLLDDGAKRSFSFATAPRDSDEFELQVRLIPGGRFTTQVFTSMKVGDLLRFEGPLGSFTLREDGVKPIIFVAGATGFAPVKSMLEHAFATGFKRQMKLYWGVRARRDLYLGELAERWAKEHANFSFIPVLSAAEPGDEWTGRTGLVHEAIFADYPDLAGHQVYACGSVQMVEAIHPELRAHGLSQDDCFSDAFHLAPRLRGEDAEMVRLGGARA